MISRRIRSFVVLPCLLAVVFSGGCAAPGGVARVPGAEQFRCDLSPEALISRLDVQARVAKGEATLNLLLLSGGGARGAWGAGYLKGWKDPDDDAKGLQMPTFDVVTGVSTGALQASYAFIGDYDSIYRLYTTTTSDKVWQKRFALSIPFSNSVLKSSPLSKLLESRVNHELLAAVDARKDGRLLCVGAVSLKNGKFREWDLTAIAAEYMKAGQDSTRGRELLNLYRMVLLASAAIPVAFPPVEISDDQGAALYVDGATRENVFIAFGRLVDLALTYDVQQFGIDASKEKRVGDLIRFNAFVIVNGQLGIAPASVDNHVVPIALRSLDALMAESMNGAIYHIDYELSQRGAEGVVNTRFTYIPADICLANSSLEFDPEAMKRQAEIAAAYGRQLTWFKFDPNSSPAGCETRTYAK